MLSRELKGGSIALSLSKSEDEAAATSITTNTDNIYHYEEERVSQSLLDWTLVRWTRNTCLLDDDDIVTDDSMQYDTDCVPFQSSEEESHASWVFSLGYLLSVIIFFPMSLQDLKVCCIYFLSKYAVISFIPSSCSLTLILAIEIFWIHALLFFYGIIRKIQHFRYLAS